MALELPGSGMQLEVSLEVSAGGELESAVGAVVRLDAGVRAPVDHQLASASEALVAVLKRTRLAIERAHCRFIPSAHVPRTDKACLRCGFSGAGEVAL